MTPLVARTRTEIREALGTDAPGLVPTMGALHAGHVALIRRSVAENERTVVSVFVNPTQFSDPADLEAYPRNFADDLAVVAEAGADLVFAPSVAEMYPPGFATAVEVGDLSRRCILVDDIVDSAGTLCNAAQALAENGAAGVYAYATHGVLSGGAVARVSASPIEMLVLTDSIVATEAVRLSRNIRQLTIAPLMAEAILRISEERSVSSLFT